MCDQVMCPVAGNKGCFGEFGDSTYKMPGNLDFSVVLHILTCIWQAVIYVKNADYEGSSVDGYILRAIPSKLV